MKRRTFLIGAAAGGLAVAAHPEMAALAQQADDFLRGPPVADIQPQRISERVWLIYSPDSFPTPENKGMMCNVTFVVTKKGVVILDSGGSLQIGEMVLRMIKTVTDKPVIAVFNSHYHGDHWLANHAYSNANPTLPIYSLAENIERIKGLEGKLWLGLIERWTNQATLGTKIVPPNTVVQSGQVLDFGDTRLKMHFYGTAHTPCDLSVEVVEDRVTHIGDIAMENRIANIDDGSYPGTFKYYKALEAAAGQQLWVPGHGRPGKGLLKDYGELMAGIWETCVKAVENGQDLSAAKGLVLKDPRVASRAARTAGFESNIGKYTSLAYLEAEKVAF
ncbi:MAG: Beta-lactamase precursor [Pseudomonadota bacterium]|jgi:glyoxylase-like metal-dependent hydrolase (beta-lactamase superfamily II)